MQNWLSRSWIVLLLFALGCAGTIGDNDVTLQPTEPDENQALVKQCPDGNAPPPPRGLRIREVALYQTVKNRLYSNGSWAEVLDGPLIAGKRGLLRIFVERVKGTTAYQPQSVRALVTVRNGSKALPLTSVRAIAEDSTEEDGKSTLDVEIDGKLLRQGTSLSVALQQEECEPLPGQVWRNVRVPEQGEQPLPFRTVGNLRVKVIPIQVKGGFAPDVSSKELEQIRQALLAYYPVPDVEISAHRESLVFPKAVPPNGLDKVWNELLLALEQRRAKDRAQGDVYYYGLFRPAETMKAFCSAGDCTIGLSWQVTQNAPKKFLGLGVLFPDARAKGYETAVHEVAHMHGLAHAPCNTQPSTQDPDYPFPDGATRWPGWDFRSHELKSGNLADIMGYCDDNWISSYNYNLLANRVIPVNKSSALMRTVGGFRPLVVDEQGSASWGVGEPVPEPPGDRRRATLRDASGATIAEIDIFSCPVSHGLPVLYVPELGEAWTTLVLDDGRTVERSAIEPAVSLE